MRDQRVVQRYLQAVEGGQANGWHTLVYGLTLAVYSLPLRQGLLGYAHQTTRGFIYSAARMLAPLRAPMPRPLRQPLRPPARRRRNLADAQNHRVAPATGPGTASDARVPTCHPTRSIHPAGHEAI